MSASPPPAPARTRERGPTGAPGHLPALSYLRKRLGAPDGQLAWTVIRHRDFRVYFIGSLASNLGTWLQNTAQVLLAYHLTGSALGVGMVAAAQYAGALVLGPWAPVIADRFGGIRTLIAVQAFSALVASGLTVLQLTGWLTEPALVGGALALGFGFTFALPVQTALLPRLLPAAAGAAEVDAAMALNSVSYNAGRAAGPSLCVAVVAFGGFGAFGGFAWPFAINAVSFVVFAAALAAARPAPQPRPPARARPWDGVGIACREQRILLLLAIVAAVTLADDPVLVLGPALASHLGAPHDWAGYFVSALGLGTVLASLAPRRPITRLIDQVLTKFPPTRFAASWEPSATSHRAAVYLLVLAIAMICYVMAPSVWAGIAAALVAGGAALVTGAVAQSTLVRAQPGQAASVMTLWAIAWAGTKPVASLLDGWIAAHWGIRWAGLVLAAPALTLALCELTLSPAARRRVKAAGRRTLDRSQLPRRAGTPSEEGVAR